jgi:hypothetical protein
MIKALVLIAGLLVVVGAVTAAWFGVGVSEDIQKLDAQIYAQRSDNAYKRAGEAGEKKIAAYQQQIEEKKGERTIWFGAALGAFAVGLAMTFLSMTGKRKRKVSDDGLVPAQSQEVSDPQ